jgi:hypothetical protein
MPIRSGDTGLIKRSIDDISSKKQMFICFPAACDAFGACLDSVPRMPGEHAVSTGTTSRSSRANQGTTADRQGHPSTRAARNEAALGNSSLPD